MTIFKTTNYNLYTIDYDILCHLLNDVYFFKKVNLRIV
jgi:hypothetical protein